MSVIKLIRNAFIIITGLVLVIVILAEVYKNDVVKLALEKGAKTFDVTVSVGTVNFSLLYNFPLATIEFSNLILTGSGDKDSIFVHNDTIANIGKLYASVDIKELIKGNFLVRKLDIENVKARYQVDSIGNSNFDFLLTALAVDTLKINQDTVKVQSVYTLDKLTLKNIELIYQDAILLTSAHVNIPMLIMKGKAEGEGFKVVTEGKAIVHRVKYQNYNLQALSNSSVNFTLIAKNNDLTIKSLAVRSGSALLNLNGSAILSDSSKVDIQFSGSHIDITENKSLLPDNLLQSYKINDISGLLDLKGSAKGYLTKTNIPRIDANLTFSGGVVQYDIYPKLSKVFVDVDFNNGDACSMKSSVFNIKKLQAKTALSAINMSAVVNGLPHPKYKLLANIDLDLNEMRPYLGDSTLKILNGNLKADVKTSGIWPDSINAVFMDYLLDNSSLDITLSKVNLKMDSLPALEGINAKMVYSPGKIEISDFLVDIPDYKVLLEHGYIKGGYKGQLSDYQNMSVQIDSLYLATPYSVISAAGNLNGLKNVNYNLNSVVNLSLEEARQWLPDSLVNNISGSLAVNMTSVGSFDADSLANQVLSLIFDNSKISVEMHDVYLNMPDTLLNVKMLSGNMQYRNDTVWLDHLSANYQGLDIDADSVSVAHIYTAVVQNKPKEVLVQGNFEVGDLDFKWIENFTIDTVLIKDIDLKAHEDAYKMNFTYKIKGNAKIKSFKYEDVFIENIKTKFLAKVDDGYYVVDGLTCHVFDGQVGASIKFEMFPNFRDVLHFKTNVKDINVSRMLKELETYIQQDDFTYKNVMGILTAQMDGKIITQNYAVVPDSMLLKGNLTLKNGILINVKPIMEIEDVAFVGLKKMSKLYFSTIESQLFMFKNKVYFPRTNIRSSSFDAVFLGMHSFGEDYAYHIKMYLNHVLTGKSSKRLKKQTENNGFEEETGINGVRPVYVVSKSENGKAKAWLDNQKDRKRMEAKVNLQKQIVSFRFDPRLVIYNTND